MSENHPLPPLTLGRSTWAIREDALTRLVEAHRHGARTLEQFATRATAAAPKATRPGGAVAVVPLTGVITPRGSLLSMLFGGGGGLMGFRQDFQEALADPDVGAIVLDVDSPGGLIDLVPETAAEIREARGTKPIVAVANTMAASAAYWIASQADELVVTPSGDVGSVGVYMVHEDWSGFNEQMGIVPTYIKAGEYKTEGNPDEPLSDEAKANWQEEVNDLYAMFVGAVAEGRNVTVEQVRDGYGQGRTLLAARALEAGMVDRIDTLDGVVRELQAPAARSAVGTAAARIVAPNEARQAAGLKPKAEDDETPLPDESAADELPADDEPAEPVEKPDEDDTADLDDAERAEIADILTA